MDLISIIAFFLLLFSLILCSIEDILTMRVSNRSIILVGIIVTAFFIQLTQYENIVIKSIYIISIIIVMFAIFFMGNLLYKFEIYGGADIKLAIALSPLIIYMNTLGGLFLLWLFGIHPMTQFIRIENSNKKLNTNKIAFIPYISAVFIVMLSLYLIYN